MKTILVLTDFSKNAKYAADTAVVLAAKIEADILLFNAYISTPLIPTAEYVAWPPEYYTVFKEESTTHLEKETERIRKAIDPHVKRKPVINYSNAEGPLALHVQKIVRENNITLIMMGTRSRTTGDFLFGNDINEVISKASCPVLLIPDKRTNIEMKTVVFATDFEKEDIESIKYLIKLSHYINFKIQVCHISEFPALVPDFDEENKILGFTDQISKLHAENIYYKNIEGDSIAKELEKFSKQVHADMLALVHRKHSIFWRIFHESPSKILIKHQKTPLMILPQHWEKKNSSVTAKDEATDPHPEVTAKKRPRIPL